MPYYHKPLLLKIIIWSTPMCEHKDKQKHAISARKLCVKLDVLALCQQIPVFLDVHHKCKMSHCCIITIGKPPKQIKALAINPPDQK